MCSLQTRKNCWKVAIDSGKKKKAVAWDDIFEIYHICVEKWVKEWADFPGGDGAERLLKGGVWRALTGKKVDFQAIMSLIITPGWRLH